MNEKKPSLLKRLTNYWNERRGMTAMANVMSGRKPRWYARPLGWVIPLCISIMIASTVAWEVFRQLAIPLLVVCIFFTLHRMNAKLDAIEAQLNNPPNTRIILNETE